MSTAASPRHNDLKPAMPVGRVSVAKKGTPKEEKLREEGIRESLRAAGGLFAFTIDASTAQVVKLEALDGSGVRRELSEEDRTALAQMGEQEGIEQWLAQAFEAGIACVLGGDDDGESADEPAEEAELRQLLLTPLIEQSPVKRFMQRDTLNRAILGTLLQRATRKAPVEGNGPPAAQQAERAEPTSTN